MSLKSLTFAAGLTLAASTAHAQDCAQVGVESAWEMDEAQIIALYDCLESAMADGYAREGDEIASAYRGWTLTSTRPAVAGPHGNRLLQTFANDIGAPEYLKFAYEGVEMPAGSVLAKESISISSKTKAARPGPLFIMTKMETGSIPETDDWLYAGVQPNGKPMGFSQSFCHDCHSAFSDQDSLAYPLEEVRVGGN